MLKMSDIMIYFYILETLSSKNGFPLSIKEIFIVFVSLFELMLYIEVNKFFSHVRKFLRLNQLKDTTQCIQ